MRFDGRGFSLPLTAHKHVDRLSPPGPPRRAFLIHQPAERVELHASSIFDVNSDGDFPRSAFRAAKEGNEAVVGDREVKAPLGTESFQINGLMMLAEAAIRADNGPGVYRFADGGEGHFIVSRAKV